MFSLLHARRCVGAAALFAAAITGCESTHKKSCYHCTTCSPCAAAAPAAPADPAAPKTTATPAPVRPMPTTLPNSDAYNELPPVSNERYIEPKTPAIVVAQKPPIEKMTLPPVVQPTMPKAEPEPEMKIEPKIEPRVEPKPAVPEHQVSIPAPVSPEIIPSRRSFPDITARPEFAHSTDYSSLTGTLSYIPQKSQWRLRFASIDEEDRYGGSVTLDVGQLMKDYHDGQLVKINGRMVDKDSREPSPHYQVSDVSAVK